MWLACVPSAHPENKSNDKVDDLHFSLIRQWKTPKDWKLTQWCGEKGTNICRRHLTSSSINLKLSNLLLANARLLNFPGRDYQHFLGCDDYNFYG